jgi:hypothetical protein
VVDVPKLDIKAVANFTTAVQTGLKKFQVQLLTLDDSKRKK